MKAQGHERKGKTKQQKHLENWWVLGKLLDAYKEMKVLKNTDRI